VATLIAVLINEALTIWLQRRRSDGITRAEIINTVYADGFTSATAITPHSTTPAVISAISPHCAKRCV